MSYDEFNGSSFDLNNDGYIDSAEGSFIEETYYSNHHDSSDDDDLCIGYSGRSSSSYNGHRKETKGKQTGSGISTRGAVLLAIASMTVLFGLLYAVAGSIKGAIVLLGVLGLVSFAASLY